MKLKIGVISSFPEVEDTYGHSVSQSDLELVVRIGLLDKAAEFAKELIEELKVDSIITVGIPIDIFPPEMLPLIYPIYPSNYDILNALYTAKRLGNRPAFGEILFDSVLYDFNHVCKILDMEVAHYQFASLENHTQRESVESVVRRMMNEGRDVIVTMGGYSHTVAKQLGFASVPILPEPQTFLSTLENVRRAFLIHKAETEKMRWLNSVFDNAKEGVLVIDREGRVVVVNDSARKFMHLDQTTILGRHVDSVHSKNPLFRHFLEARSDVEIIKSRTKSYVVNREVLYADQIPLGTAIRAYPVNVIQRLELDARRIIHESGFTASATFPDIKGDSKIFKQVKQKAKDYAGSTSNIVLYGESGCGKEVFAQSIHNASPCVTGPFVAVNCTALTESLLESELFGYEDGAFTGARKGGRAGLFELAHKGTLFLDEIGDMPLSIQVKFLRVLQERTVRRIGGNKNIPVDVRFIFATNRNLKADSAEGRFRQDLYYRINVLSVYIPPLRDHKDDLQDISQDILKRLSAKFKRIVSLPSDSFAVMETYNWPGNIRELHNFLERASFLKEPSVADIAAMLNDLKEGDAGNAAPETTVQGGAVTVELDTMRNMEKAIIKTLHEQYGWRRKTIESVLDISTSSLYRRLKEADR